MQDGGPGPGTVTFAPCLATLGTVLPLPLTFRYCGDHASPCQGLWAACRRLAFLLPAVTDACGDSLHSVPEQALRWGADSEDKRSALAEAHCPQGAGGWRTAQGDRG